MNNYITQQDKSRVLNLFRNPEKYGIKVSQRSLAIEDIFYYLATAGPMIALVNANLLHCLSCRCHNLFSVCRYLCLDQYQGHFIIIVGEYYFKNTIINISTNTTIAGFESIFLLMFYMSYI